MTTASRSRRFPSVEDVVGQDKFRCGISPRNRSRPPSGRPQRSPAPSAIPICTGPAQRRQNQGPRDKSCGTNTHPGRCASASSQTESPGVWKKASTWIRILDRVGFEPQFVPSRTTRTGRPARYRAPVAACNGPPSGGRPCGPSFDSPANEPEQTAPAITGWPCPRSRGTSRRPPDAPRPQARPTPRPHSPGQASNHQTEEQKFQVHPSPLPPV